MAFFEREQSDRKKRTFDILRRFDPNLASEVVYKQQQAENELGGLDDDDVFAMPPRFKPRQHMKNMNVKAAITIQRFARGWLTRKN
jgi:hypothetical protein